MSLARIVSPEHLPAGILLLDCRGGPEGFAQGHLAGAVHADLDRDLSTSARPDADPVNGGRHPLPEPAAWARHLGEWGITPETGVVAYDDAAGGSGAARLWWMLRSLGHPRVAVLEGGLQAALAAGLPVRTGAEPRRPAAPPYPGDRWHWPQVNLAEVDRLRQDPSWKLLDVRARPRYLGHSETLDPVAGHIPGALNLPFTDNLDEQGRFKAGEQLRAMYVELLAGTPPERLAVHCGSGVTACHTLLALELAGLPGSALYVGSWSEWCRHPLPQARE